MHQTLGSALAAHVDSHRTYNTVWPDDAEFCVVYACSTWPCGFQRHANIKFFTSREELETWQTAQHKWAELEDNHVAYRVFTWDLGPRELVCEGYSTGNVPSSL